MLVGHPRLSQESLTTCTTKRNQSVAHDDQCPAEMSAYPADRKYSADFAWLRIEGRTASIGLTSHFVEQLNDIQLIQLPVVGRTAARGDALGFVEGLKSSMDLIAPVSGVVIEVNKGLADAPQRLQKDPHGTWIAKLDSTNPAEVSELLSNVQFEEMLQASTRASKSKPPEQADRSGAARGYAASDQRIPASSATTAPADSDIPRIPPDKALRLLWSVRLGGHRLKGFSSGPQDRDYSGGSYFSWREREITLTDEPKQGGGRNRRFRWRDTSHTRVSTAGISSSTSSNTDHAGTWEIEVVGRIAYLVLQDRDRGRLRFRLEEGGRNEVLLDGQPYSISKL